MADRSTFQPAPPTTVPALLPQGALSGKPAMPLGRPFTLIGARNRAHLHLLSSTISRNHACIISTDSGLYLRDLASRTGVVVNGRRAKEVDLRDGDSVQIGSFKFKFTDPAGPVRFPVAAKVPAAMLEIDGATLTPVDGRSVLIGRRPVCDIPLLEASVSNTHALIFEVNGQHFIRDLGSRTGTLVNGKPVHHQPLDFGDEIRIGETSLRYISAFAPEAQPREMAGAEHHEGEGLIGLDFADEIESRTPEAESAPHAAAEELLPDDHEDELAPVHSQEIAPPSLAPSAQDRVRDPLALELEPVELEPLGFMAETAESHNESVPLVQEAPTPDLELPADSSFTAAPEVITPPQEEAAEAAPAAEPTSDETYLAAEYPVESGEPEAESSAPELPFVEPQVAEIEQDSTELPSPFPPPAPVQPIEVGEVDLSAVRFQPEPSPQAVEEAAEAQPESAPAPILDLIQTPPEIVAPAESLLEPEALAAATDELSIVDSGKGRKARFGRKKGERAPQSETTARRSGRRKKERPAEAVSQVESPLASETVISAAANEPQADAAPPDLAAAESQSTEHLLTAGHHIAEVLAPSEPTPESALSIEPALEATELSAPALAAESPTTEPPLSDTAFGQVVQEFATPDLGPLVEEPVPLQPPALPQDSIEGATEDTEPQGPESRVSSVHENPAESQLTADSSDLARIEPDLTLEEPRLEASEMELSLEPPGGLDELPPPRDSSIADPLSLEANMTIGSDSVQPNPAELESEQFIERIGDNPAPALSPLSLQEAGLPSLDDPRTVAAASAGNPERAEPPNLMVPPIAPPPIDPFFGMGRDLGTFIGGIPLALAGGPTAPVHNPFADEVAVPGPPPAESPLTLQAPASSQPPAIPQAPSDSLSPDPQIVETATETDGPDPQPTIAPPLASAPPPSHLTVPVDPLALEPAGEEALTFPDEHPPVPPLDLSVHPDHEPLELFDETAEQLDALPDSPETIGDITDALSDEDFQAPEAPVVEAPSSEVAPPGAPGAPRPSPFSGAAPASGRPKFVPPPPVRTSPLRAFTASNPFELEPEDLLLSEPAIPPFAGGKPPTQGRVTSAFDGLAMPPVREADVFSHTAFPPVDEAIFGPASRETPSIPLVTGKSTPGEPAALAPNEGPLPTSLPVGKQRDRRREAIPPNRQALQRRTPGQPSGPISPPSSASVPPGQQPPKRKPWWKNIRGLLPLLILTLAGAWVAIFFLLPPKHRVEAALRIKGLDKLDETSRRNQVISLRHMLSGPNVRTIALGNVQTKGISGGFLEDPAALDEMGKPHNSPFNEQRGALLFTRETHEVTGDRERMKAVLAALVAETKSLNDHAATLADQKERAERRMRDVEQQRAVEESVVQKLSDEVRAAAGAESRDLLLDPDAGVKKLENTDDLLRRSWDEAMRLLMQRRAEMERAQAAPAAHLKVDPESDPMLHQLRQSIDSLNEQLDGARLARSGKTDDAAQAFDDALQQFEQELAKLGERVDATATAALDPIRRRRDEIVRLNIQHLERRRNDGAALAQLRQRLSDARESGLRQAWDNDEQLRQFEQQREMRRHQLNTATDSGLADDAARIKGVLDDLDQKIDARRQALSTGVRGGGQLQQTVQETIARMEQDRQRDEQQMQQKLSELTSAVSAAAASSGAAGLRPAVTAMQSARQRYAAALAAAGTDTEAEIKKLEARIAERQAKLDMRRRELADSASSSLIGQQQQERAAALAAAQRLFAEVRDAETKAAQAYTDNRKLLSAERSLRDARGQLAEFSERARQARDDFEDRRAEADKTPVVLEPDENSVAIAYNPDERVNYLIAASLLILAMFAVPLWRSVTPQYEQQVPFASPLVVPHDVPHHPAEEHPVAEFESHEQALPV